MENIKYKLIGWDYNFNNEEDFGTFEKDFKGIKRSY